MPADSYLLPVVNAQLLGWFPEVVASWSRATPDAALHIGGRGSCSILRILAGFVPPLASDPDLHHAIGIEANLKRSAVVAIGAGQYEDGRDNSPAGYSRRPRDKEDY